MTDFVKEECSYGISNLDPVVKKSFTSRSKNSTKTQGNVKLFLVSGFEFVYAISALYFKPKMFTIV